MLRVRPVIEGEYASASATLPMSAVPEFRWVVERLDGEIIGVCPTEEDAYFVVTTVEGKI
jgi:hypothetical protein